MNLSWSMPYPSQRMPVFARNAVATSHPLAAAAGLAMLMHGGNAVDAALATAITLTVVEPCSNGLGSDAFAIIWDGRQLHGLNGSGRAPRAWSPERFAGLTRMPHLGWDSVTVPGAVDAWAQPLRAAGEIAFCRPVRTRDPPCARRLSGIAGAGGRAGGRRNGLSGFSRLPRALSAGRTGATHGRALPRPGHGAHAGADSRDEGRSLLPG